jgi:hypothetical protein
MSGSILLTPEVVQTVYDKTVKSLELQHAQIGQGDLRNLVFETLVTQFDLPWIHVDEYGGIPDFDDPRVKDLNKQLREIGSNIGLV